MESKELESPKGGKKGRGDYLRSSESRHLIGKKR